MATEGTYLQWSADRAKAGKLQELGSAEVRTGQTRGSVAQPSTYPGYAYSSWYVPLGAASSSSQKQVRSSNVREKQFRGSESEARKEASEEQLVS